MTRALPSDALLLAYLEGDLDPDAQREVEHHLAESAESREALARTSLVVEALSEPEAHLLESDLVQAVRDARRTVQVRSLARTRWPGIALAAALVLAGGMTAVVISWQGDPRTHRSEAPPPDPQAKSGAQSEADRWAGLQVFRLAASESRPKRVFETIKASDGLLFAYTNLGPRPYRYLMVFAVDADGRLYWFHPAYQRGAEDPPAIAIAKGRAGVELRDAIRHPLRRGPLLVCGLFLRSMARVSHVEGWIRDAYQQGRSAETLRRHRPEGASLQIIEMAVE